MAFYNVTGQDHRTRSERSLDISAHNADDAVLEAFEQGLIEIKVHELTDRDLLTKDLACFLYADPLKTKQAHAIPVNANYPPSLLLERPVVTIASAVFLGLGAFAIVELVVTRLMGVLW